MKMPRAFGLTVVLALLFVGLPLTAQWPATEKPDLDAVYKIKEEGLQRSKVMEIESYLTDVYGPRLTNSPYFREAGDWAMNSMKGWGLANVHLEKWRFGRGWQNQRMVALAMTPRAYPLIAYTKAWTPGTNGPVTGGAVIAVINNENDLEIHRGKLRGKFVLSMAMREVPPHFDAPGHRYTEPELEDLSKQPARAGGRGGRGRRRASGSGTWCGATPRTASRPTGRSASALGGNRQRRIGRHAEPRSQAFHEWTALDALDVPNVGEALRRRGDGIGVEAGVRRL